LSKIRPEGLKFKFNEGEKKQINATFQKIFKPKKWRKNLFLIQIEKKKISKQIFEQISGRIKIKIKISPN